MVDFETKSLREVRERIALSGLQDGYTYADKYVIEIFFTFDFDFDPDFDFDFDFNNSDFYISYNADFDFMSF